MEPKPGPSETVLSAKATQAFATARSPGRRAPVLFIVYGDGTTSVYESVDHERDPMYDLSLGKRIASGDSLGKAIDRAALVLNEREAREKVARERQQMAEDVDTVFERLVAKVAPYLLPASQEGR